MFAKLEQAFIRVKGANAIEALRQSARPVRVITIGGDQLTGKSTLCKDLVRFLNNKHQDYAFNHHTQAQCVTFVSAGTVFRAEAARRGVSVGELSKLAIADTDIDVSIEYETCKAIMGGVLNQGSPNHEHTVIIEGRNPAVMAAYCKATFAKQPISAIYLSCSARVQARRFVGREVDRNLAFEIDSKLPMKEYTTLKQVGSEMLSVSCPKVTEVINMFTLNEARDEDDRKRYLSAYQFPETLDYRYLGLYNIVSDTSEHLPAHTLADIASNLPSEYTEFDYGLLRSKL